MENTSTSAQAAHFFKAPQLLLHAVWRLGWRRSALQAIACSHLLKTPRYLLGHT